MIKSQIHFRSWLAGVVDGDGNFDFRRNTLKAIRIKIHIRDVRILKHIQDGTHVGRVRNVPNTSYVLYIVSSKVQMTTFLTLINGFIRVKIPSFTRACTALGLTFMDAQKLGSLPEWGIAAIVIAITPGIIGIIINNISPISTIITATIPSHLDEIGRAHV